MAGKTLVYPGWDNYLSGAYFDDPGYRGLAPSKSMRIATLFHYCKQFDDNYYYMLDVALMYGSKGGITLDKLIGKDKVIGQRTKEKYRAAIRELYQKLNEKPSDDTVSVDGNDIPAGNFNFG